MNLIKKYRSIIKTEEELSEVKKKLQKLFELNQKNINKVNDNLIKIVSDKELLYTAYENLKVIEVL